jgi:hypothetical protein
MAIRTCQAARPERPQRSEDGPGCGRGAWGPETPSGGPGKTPRQGSGQRPEWPAYRNTWRLEDGK